MNKKSNSSKHPRDWSLSKLQSYCLENNLLKKDSLLWTKKVDLIELVERDEQDKE